MRVKMPAIVGFIYLSDSSQIMSWKSYRCPGILLLFVLFLFSCKTSRIHKSNRKTDSFLQELLLRNPGKFDLVFKNPDKYRLQIVYSRIERNRKGKPFFTDYQFNVDPNLYFYPASTIKMPIALLAIEKLREGIPVNFQTTMVTMASEPWQTAVLNDPLTVDGRPNIAQYVKKIFLISDNDASNRLYEFVGQSEINTRLREMGYDSTEIIHRLSIPMSLEQNRVTNEVVFYEDSVPVYNKGAEISRLPKLPRSEKLGTGYVSGSKTIREPFDFSIRNRFLLPDLHNILRSVIFPDAVPDSQRFRIDSSDRDFVMKYMSEYPSKVGFPPYDSAQYWDAYCKFLLVGSARKPIPDNIRIYNKVGDAYGFLTDVAYITDTKNGVEFMLSATIYCNEDGIFNDNKYEYDELGFPFMKHLGEVIYQYELDRKKQ
ncbi:MAG: serine hydrolase [Flavitalea sp.]